MAKQTEINEENFSDQFRIALEASRADIASRLLALQLPTSEWRSRPELWPADERNGLRLMQVSGVQSSLLNPYSLQLLSDPAKPFDLLSTGRFLAALAQRLDCATDLGSRSSNTYPDLRGAIAISARPLQPATQSYLSRLEDVAVPDIELAEQVTQEVWQAISSTGRIEVVQCVVDGLSFETSLEYRGVRLRSLTGRERGALWQANGQHTFQSPHAADEFIIPQRLTFATPASLIELENTQSSFDAPLQNDLMCQILLSLLLHGYSLSGVGTCVVFSKPRWASFGYQHANIPLQENFIEPQKITQATFETVVATGLSMPGFSHVPDGASKQIALSRAFAGLSAPASDNAFLDLVIALEAALLRGVNSELSYRFALYGATYLHDEPDAPATFGKLRRIYAVRSKIVHGSRTSIAERQDARDNAINLTRRILQKAVTMGWPDSEQLDAQILKRENR